MNNHNLFYLRGENKKTQQKTTRWRSKVTITACLGKKKQNGNSGTAWSVKQMSHATSVWAEISTGKRSLHCD